MFGILYTRFFHPSSLWFCEAWQRQGWFWDDVFDLKWWSWAGSGAFWDGFHALGVSAWVGWVCHWQVLVFITDHNLSFPPRPPSTPLPSSLPNSARGPSSYLYLSTIISTITTVTLCICRPALCHPPLASEIDYQSNPLCSYLLYRSYSDAPTARFTSVQ